MNLDITGRHVDVTPALREFALERLGRLERLVDGPLDVHLVLRIDKRRHAAEVQLKSRGVLLTGAEETDDLYVSIGQVADKLERQLLKRKEKVRVHKPRRAAREEGAARAAAEVGGNGEGAEEPTPTPVVLTRRYRVKPMSPEDALAELEASAEELLVFREAASFRIQVLYRRRDGSYALVDPEC
jgi:putative sigma-54 modulation protein